jgi:Flp pilus assembly protein TadD
MKKTSIAWLVLSTLFFMSSCATTQYAGDTYLARKRLTRELVARQNWPQAFFYADQLHRERAKDPEVLVLRGIIYREQGLEKEAETDLKQALELSDNNAEAHSALGLLYDKLGLGAEAESHHRKATQLQPDNPAYLNNLGFSRFLRGKHHDALQVLKSAAGLDPTNRRIRTNLGFAYAADGDWPRAAYEFGKGALTPAQAKNNLAFAYERRGDLGTAYDLYLEAIRMDSRCPQARANLLVVAGKLGREPPADLPMEDNTERTAP